MPADSGRLAGHRVLVVDDNRDAAESLAALLECDGAVVAVAGDGPEALALAESFAPDLAVLDIGLPGMTGYELCEALRATPRGRAMRIVALTGWGQRSDRARSRLAGFDHHLVKPADHSALLAALLA